MRRDPEIYPSRSPQSRTRLLCSRRPTTHLRVAARPCSPCFHLFIHPFSRAAPHDAGSSGGAAASQCCSSLKQHLFVAARRHRRCFAAARRHRATSCEASALNCARFAIPVHVDPCGDDINIGMGTKPFMCAISAPLRLTGRPAAFAEHATNHRPLHLSVSLTRDVWCDSTLHGSY